MFLYIKKFDIRIENHKTGADVRIKGDHPLSKVVFWGSSTTLCSETYIDIKIEPGSMANGSLIKASTFCICMLIKNRFQSLSNIP